MSYREGELPLSQEKYQNLSPNIHPIMVSPSSINPNKFIIIDGRHRFVKQLSNGDKEIEVIKV